MGTRLEESIRKVTWVEERTIRVGYHDCDVCGMESPEPTTAEIVTFAKGNSGCFMWPGEHWIPPGWTTDNGIICIDCTAAKEAAFANRRAMCKQDEPTTPSEPRRTT